MPVAWSYRPPARNAVPLVHAAGEAATRAAAEHLLEASKRLVPVDTGALRDSGHVTPEGLDAAVSYEGMSPDGYDYGIRVHEDLNLHHPNGGQALFLTQPMHSETGAIAEILAETIRRALRA